MNKLNKILIFMVLILNVVCNSKEKTVVEEKENTIIKKIDINTVENTYEVFVEKFNYKSENKVLFTVPYAQVKNMKNKEIEEKVNQILKDDMLSWINEDCEWVEPLKVEVQLKSSKYLSITYMREWLPSGNTTFEPYTYLGVTVDMETGKRMKLLDFFEDNAENFKLKILSHDYSDGYLEFTGKPDLDEINEIIKTASLTNKEYLDLLFEENASIYEYIKSYLGRRNSFYLTKNKLVIVKNQLEMPRDLRDIFLIYKIEDIKKNSNFEIGKIKNSFSNYKIGNDINKILDELEKYGIKELVNEKPSDMKQGVYLQYLNDYAFFLSETDRYKEAIPILQKTIELSPERVVAYLNLGDCYYKEYQKNKKQDDLNKVIENYKKYVELLKKGAKIPNRVEKVLTQ